jgi:hypothetical protein
MKLTSLLFLAFALLVLACARQPSTGVVTPARPTNAAPAPAPKPATGPISPTRTDRVPAQDRAAFEEIEAERAPAEDLRREQIPVSDPNLPPGRRPGYVPRVAENETAIIENQGSVGTAPLTEEQTGPEVDEEARPVMEPLLTVVKSPCFGDCDVYRYEVFPDGRMLLDVEAGLRRPGMYEQQMSVFDREDLVKSLDSLRQQSYAPVYPEDPDAIPDDGSYTLISYPGQDGETESITVYYDAPEEVRRFIRRMQTLIEAQAWSAQ